jgi:hypothetical protein
MAPQPIRQATHASVPADLRRQARAQRHNTPVPRPLHIAASPHVADALIKQRLGIQILRTETALATPLPWLLVLRVGLIQKPWALTGRHSVGIVPVRRIHSVAGHMKNVLNCVQAIHPLVRRDPRIALELPWSELSRAVARGKAASRERSELHLLVVVAGARQDRS